MRTFSRTLTIGLLIPLAFVSGCIQVAKGTVKGHLNPRDAIVLDGKIYIVDTHTGEVSRLDVNPVSDAKPFERSTSEATTITIVED